MQRGLILNPAAWMYYLTIKQSFHPPIVSLITQYISNVIIAGVACHLYFDIEFKIEFNPAVDPILLLETFIEVLQ